MILERFRPTRLGGGRITAAPRSAGNAARMRPSGTYVGTWPALL